MLRAALLLAGLLTAFACAGAGGRGVSLLTVVAICGALLVAAGSLLALRR